MADSDELTVHLLPGCVTGSAPTTISNEPRPLDFDSLVKDVVQEGIRTSNPDQTDLHSKVVDRVEKELIAQVLSASNFVQTKAATRLGINRNTLHKKMKDYNLEGQDSSE